MIECLKNLKGNGNFYHSLDGPPFFYSINVNSFFPRRDVFHLRECWRLGLRGRTSTYFLPLLPPPVPAWHKPSLTLDTFLTFSCVVFFVPWLPIYHSLFKNSSLFIPAVCFRFHIFSSLACITYFSLYCLLCSLLVFFSLHLPLSLLVGVVLWAWPEILQWCWYAHTHTPLLYTGAASCKWTTYHSTRIVVCTQN